MEEEHPVIKDRSAREYWLFCEKHKTFRTRHLEFIYFLRQGLKPEHKLLDVGCGFLRCGLLFMEYLDVGNYYGFDKEERYLRAGVFGVLYWRAYHREPNILYSKGFDFGISEFGTEFDFAIALSVLNHNSEEGIKTCIRSVVSCLKPHGKFYASFVLGDSFEYGVRHKKRRGEFVETRQPFSFYEDNFSDICKITNLGCPGWPGKQHLLLIERR
jgi:SAM-dependent methyltransferase